MGSILLTILGIAIIATNVQGVERGKNMVCYFTNWSQYRHGEGKFNEATDVDANLCTHIVYAFMDIGDDNRVKTREWNEAKMIRNLMKLKQSNPALLITAAVGGWNAASTAFTRICSSDANMENFANSAVQFLRQWKFDGIDIDWEYPGATDRGSRVEDKQRYTMLLKKLRTKFLEEAAASGKPRLRLTAAVPAGRNRITDGYEIPQVCNTVDLVHLMTYDLHGTWESTTDHHSRLRGHNINVEDSVNAWIEGGCPREKIVLGIPLYGRGFTLTNPANSGYGAARSGPSRPGQYTHEAGFLAYYEICQMSGTPVVDNSVQAPYKVSGDQWIGYEDVESVRRKVQFLQSKQLGGAMVWSLDLDDFKGTCSSHKRMVLSKAIKDALAGSSVTTAPTHWTQPAPVTTTKASTTQSGVFTCAGKADGNYADPVNKNIYHACVAGRYDHVMDCPANLVFNGVLCTWP